MRTYGSTVRFSGLREGRSRAKFEEIAAFADIGEFIDQPVKTYSSGMLVRLAFSIQTAVSPEILIVDEALSVGDVFFQAKCMARLRKLLADGITLLFVSHDAGTVRQLCSRAVLLHRGKRVAVGTAREVADRYLHMELEERNAAAGKRHATEAEPDGGPSASVGFGEQPRAPSGPSVGTAATPPDSGSGTAGGGSVRDEVMLGANLFAEKARFNRAGNRQAHFENVQMLKDGRLSNVFEYGDEVVLRQVVRFTRAFDNVNVAYKIRTPQGADVVFGDTRLVGRMGFRYQAGSVYVFDWRFQLNLGHGNYCIMSGLAHPPVVPGEDWRFLDMVPICYDFRVLPRQEGMIGGLVVWDNQLDITDLADAVGSTHSGYASSTEPRISRTE